MNRGKYDILPKDQARRVSLGIVFAYVFYLLFPHFDAVTHVHEGGNHGHTHSFLSVHDVALERAVLAIAPEGRPQGELATQSKPRPAAEAKAPPSSPEGLNGTPQIKNQHPGAHTHFLEDPNLPTLAAATISASVVTTALPAPVSVPGFVPALAILASPARAPPFAARA